VAVSAPYDLHACARAMDESKTWGALYRASFLRSLKRKALQKAARFSGQLDVGLIRSASTFREFDEHVTAKVNGFAGAEDYWARCSSGPMLGRIRRPALLISSKDDPIAPIGSALDGLDNPLLTPVITASGGHVGFVAGQAPRWRFWCDEVAWQYLDAASAP
jgi:predicted alpha/beta-fold hydrolase